MKVNVKTSLDSEVIPPDVALCLYRVAQESLHNAAKHSGTRQAEVTVERVGGELELIVTDAGQGFDSKEWRQGGLGLTSMEERVRLAGGTLDIESSPQKGTRVRARVPCVRTIPLVMKAAASSL